MIELIFCACLAIVLYVYAGYPLLLGMHLLGKRKSSGNNCTQTPLISIIVPARNEELAIEAKLNSLLACDYPRERVEILIGSDGSSDRTEEIVQRYSAEGIGLISFPQQQGKSAIQNGLVALSSGSILVFTDADCLFPGDALRRIVAHFVDPRIGLVTARPRFANAQETNITENESVYLRYETWLRQRESDAGVLAMASGSLFAMRRSLWQSLDRNLGDDFVLPLRIARAGFRNILEPGIAVVTRLSQNAPGSMLRAKMRIISKDCRTLLAYRDLLNPFRYPSLALGLWSHKLLRWLVPYFLIGLFATNLLLLVRPAHLHSVTVFFGLQVTFYAVALAGFALRNRRPGLIWAIPMSFCVVNLAALMGTMCCFAGRTSGQWETERVPSPVRHTNGVTGDAAL